MEVTPPPHARAEREQTFENLYRRHHRDVYRSVLRTVGSREDAEDVTQSAFLNAFRAYVSGPPPERPRAWLFAIADNVGRRRFRDQGRRPREVVLDDEPDDAALDVSTTLELREALEQLPHNQRAALVLREVGGLSYAEIAEHLD